MVFICVRFVARVMAVVVSLVWFFERFMNCSVLIRTRLLIWLSRGLVVFEYVGILWSR